MLTLVCSLGIVSSLVGGESGQEDEPKAKREAPRQATEVKPAYKPNMLPGTRFFGLTPREFSFGRLIESPDIQEEIGLKKEQVPKLSSVLQEHSRGMMAAILAQRQPETKRPTREFDTIVDRLNQESDEAIGGALTKAQRVRLEEIALQLEGPRAVIRPRVYSKLNIGPDQLAYLRSVVENRDNSSDEIRRESDRVSREFEQRLREEESSFDPRKKAEREKALIARKQVARQRVQRYAGKEAELESATNAKIWGNLTKNQKRSFLMMRGAPFDTKLLRTMTPSPPQKD